MKLSFSQRLASGHQAEALRSHAGVRHARRARFCTQATVQTAGSDIHDIREEARERGRHGGSGCRIATAGLPVGGRTESHHLKDTLLAWPPCPGFLHQMFVPPRQLCEAPPSSAPPRPLHAHAMLSCKGAGGPAAAPRGPAPTLWLPWLQPRPPAAAPSTQSMCPSRLSRAGSPRERSTRWMRSSIAARSAGGPAETPASRVFCRPAGWPAAWLVMGVGLKLQV
jgi:hypothetical protein